MPSEKFACKPQILAPRAANYFKASSENATISCKARGSPAPDILWLYNKRPINTHDQRLTVKTYKEINKREILELVTSELTISGLRHYDKGSYICAAINSGGREEVELQLDLTIELLNKRTFISDANNTMFMIVCIILGFLFILLFTVVIVCCYCRKVKNQQKKSSVSDNNRLITVGGLTKSNGKSLNESVLDGSVIIEMQKSLLTEVNPVEKPPRRTELDSIEKDLEDAHDANQTLLDEETAFS